MPKITRFEDLHCWKMARILVGKVYLISNQGKFKQDYSLKDQIRRAAVSIMNNVAEGFTRYHKKESIRFLDFAQSSSAEVRSMLYLAEDLKYISPEKSEELRMESTECQKMILALIRHYNT